MGGPSLGKSRKTNELDCLQSTASRVLNGFFSGSDLFFRDKIFPWFECFRSQVFANPNGVSTPLLFSGPDIAGSSSAGNNVHPILNDPEVRSLERLLRVRRRWRIKGCLCACLAVFWANLLFLSMRTRLAAVVRCFA